MNFTTTPPTTPGFYAWRLADNTYAHALKLAYGADGKRQKMACHASLSESGILT